MGVDLYNLPLVGSHDVGALDSERFQQTLKRDLTELRPGTSDVAERLGVSDRAVTKRAVALGGRKVGHRWLYDRTTVAVAARQREECNGQ